MRDYRDKVCIITGGGSGLGLALGRQLAAAGATVVLADMDEAALQREHAALSGSVYIFRVDVTDPASVQALVEDTHHRFGRIDYLFNNAGTAVAGEIRDLTLEQWRKVIDVNLFGEIHCIHAVYPLMIRQGFGHIVNTASGFGMAPGPLNSPYVASKFAIFGLSHALAAEARGLDVDVSVVCPGYLDTPMVRNLNPVNADPAAMRAQLPAKFVPVDQAASIVLRGVARRKRVIAFPAYVGILAFMHRFLPPLFDRLAARQVSNFRKIRVVEGDGDRA